MKTKSIVTTLLILALSSQTMACSMLGRAFSSEDCIAYSARQDLDKVAIKELVKNGWPEETVSMLKPRVSYPEDISRNSDEFKCRAVLHVQVGERSYEAFTWVVYYNYNDYKVSDYKSDFSIYQKQKITDMLNGMYEPRAKLMKKCDPELKLKGKCEDGRDKLN